MAPCTEAVVTAITLAVVPTRTLVIEAVTNIVVFFFQPAGVSKFWTQGVKIRKKRRSLEDRELPKEAKIKDPTRQKKREGKATPSGAYIAVGLTISLKAVCVRIGASDARRYFTVRRARWLGVVVSIYSMSAAGFVVACSLSDAAVGEKTGAGRVGR